MKDEERLTNLETALAFQGRTVEELNEALIEQQGRIDQLEALLRSVSERLPPAGGEVRDPADEEPPPHY